MMKSIDLSLIYGNPNQPRKRFDEDELRDLAGSIRENGLLQPITVRADGEGRYMIVAGERRFRAHQIIREQSDSAMSQIQCIISTVDDSQLAIDAIIENDQRVDVTLMEQARSYNRMIELHGFTPETLAKKLGKQLVRVTERLRLLNLTEECQHLLERGQLYQTQAYYLAGLSPAGQGKLLKQINNGQCRTVTALRDIAAAIADAEAQTSMFGDGPLPEPEKATVVEVSSARTFEAQLETVANMLRRGIDDNTITAVRKVNPGRAATIAELLAAMQKDLHRMEAAFRVAAVRDELAA